MPQPALPGEPQCRPAIGALSCVDVSAPEVEASCADEAAGVAAGWAEEDSEGGTKSMAHDEADPSGPGRRTPLDSMLSPLSGGVTIPSDGGRSTLPHSGASLPRKGRELRLEWQPFFLLPGPPNLGLSRQAVQLPQSSPVTGVTVD